MRSGRQSLIKRPWGVGLLWVLANGSLRISGMHALSLHAGLLSLIPRRRLDVLAI